MPTFVLGFNTFGTFKSEASNFLGVSVFGSLLLGDENFGSLFGPLSLSEDELDF